MIKTYSEEEAAGILHLEPGDMPGLRKSKKINYSNPKKGVYVYLEEDLIEFLTIHTRKTRKTVCAKSSSLHSKTVKATVNPPIGTSMITQQEMIDASLLGAELANKMKKRVQHSPNT